MTEDYQSWDEFWAEVQPAKTETIRGVTVNVPTDLPMRFAVRLQEVLDSESEDDIRALLGDVFGEDVLDQWIDAGMGTVELQVVLTWAISHGTGRDVSFHEAFELYQNAKNADDNGGKAPAAANRAGRRAKSNVSGRSSKPISRASTSSRRTR